MTKKLSDAFFGDKKLTEVTHSPFRRYTHKSSRGVIFSRQISATCLNPTLPNWERSPPKTVMRHSSTSSANS